MAAKVVDLKEVEAYTIVDAEGRLALTEAYYDLSAADDNTLRKLRNAMIAKHADSMTAFTELGDGRYSTPDGTACLRDMNYYSTLISRIESEMAYRMITLD